MEGLQIEGELAPTALKHSDNSCYSECFLVHIPTYLRISSQNQNVVTPTITIVVLFVLQSQHTQEQLRYIPGHHSHQKSTCHASRLIVLPILCKIEESNQLTEATYKLMYQKTLGIGGYPVNLVYQEVNISGKIKNGRPWYRSQSNVIAVFHPLALFMVYRCGRMSRCVAVPTTKTVNILALTLLDYT